MSEDEKKVGRPTVYTQELAEEICEEISCTDDSLEELCQRNPHWPDRRTIYRWRRKHPEFCHLYAQAKIDQIEVLVDKADDIAKDKRYDSELSDDGNERPNHEWINRSRLRVDLIKWKAAKLMPKLYGDKIQAEHSGKDGKPIQFESVTLQQAVAGFGEILDAARGRAAQDICEEDSGSD